MGKATNRKTKDRRAAGNVHPLIRQADIPAAQRAARAYEIAQVPNPHGEAVIRGEVRPHKAVRIKPAFREMFERRTFERVTVPGYSNGPELIRAALEWYDQRLDVAGSGLTRCGLGVAMGGAGGGSAGSGIPVSLAAMEARSDVARVRAAIPDDLRPAFDAVMIDGERFAETARRMCARRYVRVSEERQRRRLAEQFVAAAVVLAQLWGAANTRQRGAVVAAQYGEAA